MKLYPEHIWYILGTIFLAIGIIGGLGEWVFHWWEDPWQWASPVSLLMGVAAFAWGASARGVRSEGRATREDIMTESRATREDIKTELRATREDIKTELRATREDIKTELRATREDIKSELQATRGELRALRDGQSEQTSLLREVVASFRRQ